MTIPWFSLAFEIISLKVCLFSYFSEPKKSKKLELITDLNAHHFGPLMSPNICYCNHFS